MRQSYVHMQQPLETTSKSSWMVADLTRQSSISPLVASMVTSTRWTSSSLIAWQMHVISISLKLSTSRTPLIPLWLVISRGSSKVEMRTETFPAAVNDQIRITTSNASTANTNAYRYTCGSAFHLIRIRKSPLKMAFRGPVFYVDSIQLKCLASPLHYIWIHAFQFRSLDVVCI